MGTRSLDRGGATKTNTIWLSTVEAQLVARRGQARASGFQEEGSLVGCGGADVCRDNGVRLQTRGLRGRSRLRCSIGLEETLKVKEHLGSPKKEKMA